MSPSLRLGVLDAKLAKEVIDILTLICEPENLFRQGFLGEFFRFVVQEKPRIIVLEDKDSMSKSNDQLSEWGYPAGDLSLGP